MPSYIKTYKKNIQLLLCVCFARCNFFVNLKPNKKDKKYKTAKI